MSALLQVWAADAAGIGLTIGMLGAVFALGELLHRRGVAAEATRKVVHVLAGAPTAVQPWVLHDWRSMVLMGALFTALLLLARALGWLPSLHSVSRSSYGTVLYPVGVLAASALTWDRPALFAVSVAVLALGDGLAAIVGQRWGRRRYPVGGNERSVEGSAVMFGVGVLATAALLPALGVLDGPEALGLGLVVGALAAAVEGISPLGSDNLTVPVAAAWLLGHGVDGDLVQLGLGAVVCGAISAVSVRRRHLTVSGGLAAWLVGFVVTAVGGWGWLLSVLLVFVVVNAASRVARGSKPLQGKGATRDHAQILCNVGVAIPAALGWSLTGELPWVGAFLGAVAFAAADTLASEVGVLSHSLPVSITTFRPVPRGSSGGVTWAGYAAAAAGALLPPFGLAIQLGALPLGWVLASVSAGLVGCTVDSELGDRLQVRYRCPGCRRLVETQRHCDRPTVHVRGLGAMDNDAVNLLGSLSSALVGAGVLAGGALLAGGV